MAGTLHGIHAITSRLSPAGNSSGAQVIEGESFKMTIHLTATGVFDTGPAQISTLSELSLRIGTKFVLLTTIVDNTADTLLPRIYEAYADTVMKNPFHTPEMPIRSEAFDLRMASLLGPPTRT